MSEAVLNVTFGYSAAGSLKLALERLKRSEQVAPLPDDFTMGPLDPGDAQQRAEWEREELGYDETIANSEDVEEFWKSVLGWSGRLVVWMSSRSAVELCGLHALLWRVPHANVHLIDVGIVELGPTAPYDDGQAFAIMRDERMVELGLIDAAKALTDLERASYRKRWQQLRQENAPLRVLTDHGLESAPIDYFDERLRQLITDEWQSGARILGNCLAALGSSRFKEFSCDVFLFDRMVRLLEGDKFEGQPDEDGLYSGRSKFRRRRSR